MNDGTNTYYWDAEGHLSSVVNGAGTVISQNTYNALGQRVGDVTPAAVVDEAYGAAGSLLLRYTGDSNSRSFVPFQGRLLAEYYCGGMMFDHQDGLGSVTTTTDCTGQAIDAKLFYPFGESWTGATNPNLPAMRQTFAQLPDYDPETDQYNTLNRHYSPSGRWLSPDPGGINAVKLEDPQTWNMYAYVRNNPTTLTDPTGLCDHGDAQNTCNADPVQTQGNTPNAKAQKEQEQKAEVGYGETSGLVPERSPDAPANKKSPYDSSTWDPKSTENLQDARQNIMDISDRNSNVKKSTPSDPNNPIEKQAWNANMDAAKKSDGSKSGNYFFIRQEGVGKQRPSKTAGYG